MEHFPLILFQLCIKGCPHAYTVSYATAAYIPKNNTKCVNRTPMCFYT